MLRLGRSLGALGKPHNQRLVATAEQMAIIEKMTSFWGSSTRRGFISLASIKLKMAELASIPRASESTATVPNPGFFSNWRKANLRSFMMWRVDTHDAKTDVVVSAFGLEPEAEG